ncbi:MAG: hypothetical protein A3J97_15565 [Spirochaetes bacterium RIFOXYC1_FULL_54_7]|nr:MAG: hypothetical protein A3J97_15565 [Spirochaetes bacterium RIFOXYC1_FULL_54_7]
MIQPGNVETGATGFQFGHNLKGAVGPGLVIIQTLHSQSPATEHDAEEFCVRAPTCPEHEIFAQAGRDIFGGIVSVPGYAFYHFVLPRKQESADPYHSLRLAGSMPHRLPGS